MLDFQARYDFEILVSLTSDIIVVYSPESAVTHAQLDAKLQEIEDELQGKAPNSHTHTAGDITSGVFPIARGGTGASTANAALSSLGAEPARTVATQAEAEAGTSTIVRAWTPQRVAQAAAAAATTGQMSTFQKLMTGRLI